MALYQYSAIDAKGAKSAGLQAGDNPSAVRKILRDEGIVVLSLHEARDPAASGKRQSWRPFKSKLSDLALSMILRQMATLLEAGMVLDEVLLVMAVNSDDAKDQLLLHSWRSALLEGESLGNAMRHGSQRVSENLTAAVDVAEQTGCLAPVLERLAQEKERALDNERTLRGALAYPCVLIVVALSALIFVVTNIVPKITTVFTSQKTELPLVTRLVMTVSDFLVSYGMLLGLVIALLVVGFLVAMQRKTFKYRVHRALIELPKIGQWIRLADLSDWCRNMALLLDSGVPVLQAIQIANQTAKNLALRRQLAAVVAKVRAGDSLREALGQQSYIPAFMLHLLGSGERGSRLSPMLTKVADYYSKMLAANTEMMLKVLNPLLLILIAGVVFVIIMGVITPIMQMNSMV